ncbi:MAG: hypothetical protein ACRD5L_08785, partial [Bryobacteraceae bacterium]
TTDRSKLESLGKFCGERGIEFHAISSATGEGIAELVYAMGDALDRIPRVSISEGVVLDAENEPRANFPALAPREEEER